MRLFQALRQPVIAVPAEMHPVKLVHVLCLFPAAAALVGRYGRKKQIGGAQGDRSLGAPGAVKALAAHQIVGEAVVFGQDHSPLRMDCVCMALSPRRRGEHSPTDSLSAREMLTDCSPLGKGGRNGPHAAAAQSKTRKTLCRHFKICPTQCPKNTHRGEKIHVADRRQIVYNICGAGNPVV